MNYSHPYALTARVTAGGQVCRPHFHSPLHPWISATGDGKPPMVPHPAHGHHHPPAPSWCSPFGSAGKGPAMSSSSSHPPHASPPGMAVAHAPPTGPSHSSPHLFSFPPTPPKDATPDNVSGGGGGSASTSQANGQANGGGGGGSLGTDFGSGSSSSSTQAIACSSVGSDTMSSAAGAISEMKPYYVNAASHHNMITSLGSALSNCSSSKPREGTGAPTASSASNSFAQSPHTAYHSSSLSPYYPAHYVGAGAGAGHPPTAATVGDLSASSPYGFAHHSHHSSSSLLSAKSMSTSSANKHRTKGRSSAGKRRQITHSLTI
jgi:hypothetical protein